MSRIEITFRNGNFRAFPKVTGSRREKNWLMLRFGEHNHTATINVKEVLFMEEMTEAEN